MERGVSEMSSEHSLPDGESWSRGGQAVSKSPERQGWGMCTAGEAGVAGLCRGQEGASWKRAHGLGSQDGAS